MQTEITLNLHMHTPYSDGFGSHREIAESAIDAGIDVALVTDHNVWVNGPEGYYQRGAARVLLLVGEEIHDQARDPQKNHLLVFGADRELAPLAENPQNLIDAAIQAGGLAFLAHPKDPENALFRQPDLSWVSWDVQRYTGLELWNALSEFKSLLKSRLHALLYALNPERIASGPFPETLERWDRLLAAGQKVVAIGGSDAHALPERLGPITRTIFPYRFHFRCINTHVLLPKPLSGELDADKELIFAALRSGHAFIGYDLPAPTRGFRFSAQGKTRTALMGDDISVRNGVTLQIRLPRRTPCKLIRDGQTIKEWQNRAHYTHITNSPGVYRVEAYIHYHGKLRSWIYSNPIYVRDA